MQLFKTDRFSLFFLILTFCTPLIAGAGGPPTNPLPDSARRLEIYNTPKTYHFDEVTVTAISTGYISIKGSFPHPVFAWLIQTPTENYLIDSGLSNQVNDSDYFGGISRGVFRKKFTFYRYDENNLMTQLSNLKLSPTDLKNVILTHAHFDHVGYLTQFKKVPILISQAERDKVDQSGQLGGYMNKTGALLDSAGVQTVPIDLYQSKKLNSYLTLIRTGVHTPGHLMVLLQTKSSKVLFTGDTPISSLNKNEDPYLTLDKLVGLSTARLFYNHDSDLTF